MSYGIAIALVLLALAAPARAQLPTEPLKSWECAGGVRVAIAAEDSRYQVEITGLSDPIKDRVTFKEEPLRGSPRIQGYHAFWAYLNGKRCRQEEKR
jgi:hypothetical protein